MEIRKRSNLLRAVIGCVSLMLLQLNSPFVNADGLETLGPTPLTPTLGPGTAIITEGVGTELTQPGVISFNVPAGATVERALLYWEGYMLTGLGDSQILVDGSPVTGTLIQSGVLTIQNNPDANSSAYRADITTLVSPGANSLSINGMDFTKVNHGAGVVVVINDGSGPAHIELRDGNDFAFNNPPRFTDPQLTTIPQVFSFVADTVNDRTATLDMMFASVAGEASGGGFRPSSIKVTVGASGTPVYYNDQLNSNDGQEWDSLQIPLTIPAGADQVEVQALSEDRGTTGGAVASFHWLTAGLAITPPPPPPPGGEGCTPGFWKQRQHFPAWAPPYVPVGSGATLFNDVFDDVSRFNGWTLRDVLKAKGGGINALGRHTVAALLNTANSDISYDLTTSQVIDDFNAVYPGTKSEYNAQKRIFSAANESGCPINGKTAPGDL